MRIPYEEVPEANGAPPVYGLTQAGSYQRNGIARRDMGLGERAVCNSTKAQGLGMIRRVWIIAENKEGPSGCRKS